MSKLASPGGVRTPCFCLAAYPHLVECHDYTVLDLAQHDHRTRVDAQAFLDAVAAWDVRHIYGPHPTRDAHLDHFWPIGEE